MTTEEETEKWQAMRGTVAQRNKYMFNNPLLSDIKFAFPNTGKIIPAHKYVLAISSSVFFAMFYGDLAGRTVEQVKHSHVSSIEIIHQYNPSRNLNRCIKITAKQRHVFDDSELSLAKSSSTFCGAWLRSEEDVVYGRPKVCRQEMREQNCWPEVLLKCDIRAFCLLVLVASDKKTLSQWHFVFFRYFWYNISFIEG